MTANRFNFRVWDKKNKIFNDDFHLFPVAEDGMMLFDRKSNFDYVEHNEDNNYILMQSTGLVDKNGKEIFENCIINNNFLVVFKNYKFILINILNNDIVDFYEYTEKNRIEITDEYKQI